MPAPNMLEFYQGMIPKQAPVKPLHEAIGTAIDDVQSGIDYHNKLDDRGRKIALEQFKHFQDQGQIDFENGNMRGAYDAAQAANQLRDRLGYGKGHKFVGADGRGQVDFNNLLPQQRSVIQSDLGHSPKYGMQALTAGNDYITTKDGRPFGDRISGPDKEFAPQRERVPHFSALTDDNGNVTFFDTSDPSNQFVKPSIGKTKAQAGPKPVAPDPSKDFQVLKLNQVEDAAKDAAMKATQFKFPHDTLGLESAAIKAQRDEFYRQTLNDELKRRTDENNKRLQAYKAAKKKHNSGQSWTEEDAADQGPKPTGALASLNAIAEAAKRLAGGQPGKAQAR